MNKLKVLVITLSLAMSISTIAQAYPPTYLLLGTPYSEGGRKPSRGDYPGYGQRLQTSTYSYGWFGVQPRRHWSSHYGYYRQYREWSAK